MYDFIDVNEQQTRQILPSEAMQIDGKYIENIISGYRTLHVEGRELLPSDVLSDDNDFQNGSKYKGYRYPSRVIKVTYQLSADDNNEFRQSFNVLNGILDFEEAKLIFNDEPDMYFVGTKSSIDEVEPGVNNVIGAFEIICTDPFKYSVDEITETFPYGIKEMEVDYQGTYKVYPVIQIKPWSDTGFFALYNEHGGLLQIGDPEEIDKIPGKKTETLIAEEFTAEAFAESEWRRDDAVVVDAQSSWQQNGLLEIKPGGNLRASSFGGHNGGWHGPSITKVLPADSSGHTGSKNWTISWKSLVSVEDPKELGDMEILVTGRNRMGTRVNLAGLAIWKTHTGFREKIGLYSEGKMLRLFETSALDNTRHLPDYPYYNYEMSKFGSKLEFQSPTGRYEFVNPAIEEIEAIEVSVVFAAFTGWKPFKMELANLRFRTHGVDWFEDIPNKFTKGDLIEIDCGSGEILLNNNPAPELGAIGNTWEQCYLEHGVNSLAFAYSSWAQCPDVSVRYRRVLI